MLNVRIKTQPNDETCGPTSLHAIYNYYHDNIKLSKVVAQVETVKGGGTIAPLLGKHALERGYKVSLYVYNLNQFDPTWFRYQQQVDIVEKLKQQAKHERSEKYQQVTEAYIDFVELGGEILFKNLTVKLLKKYFSQNIPILTGLSATYLYESAREYVKRNGEIIDDDVRGEPVGHFVVLCGHDKRKNVVVADPHKANPISENNYYSVKMSRLINSIMLGVLTYDANLLIIHRRKE